MATSRKSAGNEVVEVEENGNADVTPSGATRVTLANGAVVDVYSISTVLIYDATQQIEEPSVPLVKVSIKGREQLIENPDHPDYLRRINDVQSKRNMVIADIILQHAVVLVSPLPEDDKWLVKLARNIKSIEDYMDNDGEVDEEDKKYLYLRYIAMTQNDLSRLISAAVPSEEGVSEEEEKFPGDEE